MTPFRAFSSLPSKFNEAFVIFDATFGSLRFVTLFRIARS